MLAQKIAQVSGVGQVFVGGGQQPAVRVRIDPDVNRFIWNQGIRNIPRRIRVRLSRRKNEEDESGNKFYTEVKLLNVETFKGLLTEKSRDE